MIEIVFTTFATISVVYAYFICCSKNNVYDDDLSIPSLITPEEAIRRRLIIEEEN